MKNWKSKLIWFCLVLLSFSPVYFFITWDHLLPYITLTWENVEIRLHYALVVFMCVGLYMGSMYAWAWVDRRFNDESERTI